MTSSQLHQWLPAVADDPDVEAQGKVNGLNILRNWKRPGPWCPKINDYADDQCTNDEKL